MSKTILSRSMKATGLAAVFVLAAGCASTGSVEEAQSRADEAMRAAEQAQSAAEEAQRAAESAESTAASAERSAQNAEQAANEARDSVRDLETKLDRMMERSQRK